MGYRRKEQKFAEEAEKYGTYFSLYDIRGRTHQQIRNFASDVRKFPHRNPNLHDRVIALISADSDPRYWSPEECNSVLAQAEQNGTNWSKYDINDRTPMSISDMVDRQKKSDPVFFAEFEAAVKIRDDRVRRAQGEERHKLEKATLQPKDAQERRTAEGNKEFKGIPDNLETVAELQRVRLPVAHATPSMTSRWCSMEQHH